MTAREQYGDRTLSTLSFWEQSHADRDSAIAALRARHPVSWQPQMDTSLEERFPDKGFWAILGHADVQTIARNPQAFIAAKGITIDDVPEELYTRTTSFLAMDAPEHTRIRRVVSAAFTPRQVARTEETVRERARTIVDELIERGPCDFVEHVAARLPLWTICEMLGIADTDKPTVAAAVDAIIGRHDPEQYGDVPRIDAMIAGLERVEGVARDMARHRRNAPQDDLLSNLVHSEVDGESLTDDEVVSAFVLLAMAGHDTTRHTTSLAMKALCEYPDQRMALQQNLDHAMPAAVEEFLRWGTVVMNNRRTATRDTSVGGVPIAAGDKVVLLYYSANRDPAVFDDPHNFLVGRTPNNHVAFGAGGPHFCLGASLARSQLRSIFSELLTRVPDIEVGRPRYLVSPTINGVVAMPCDFSRPR